MFIVLYGINNLGKSTQAKKLVERLNQEGYTTEYLKYPMYDLAPSGPILNAYLRKGNPYALSPREAQLLYVLNRTQYEPILKERLAQGIHIVAEDYIGTGIAWGIGADVEADFMKQINTHLLTEDLAFFFDGERFSDSIEKNHRHETDSPLLKRVREAHQKLAQQQGWIPINANDSIESIHTLLWAFVSSRLL